MNLRTSALRRLVEAAGGAGVPVLFAERRTVDELVEELGR